MDTLKRSFYFLIIALLTALLIGCGDPAADREETEEEELQDEVEENDEEEQEENDEEKDNDDGYSGSGSSNSGFSHTVEMEINGEVKEGEGEEWWKEVDNGNDDDE